MMMNGNYEHCLDQKYRTRIPSKLKALLGEIAPVITKGVGKCLYIYPNTKLLKIQDLLENNPPQDFQDLWALRMYASSMFNIDEDNQGRFTVSQTLREYAGIVKDIVFVGVYDHIEMWAKESWDNYCNNNDTNLDEALMKFVKLGL